MTFINHQKYSCCQVVSAINALIFLGGDRIEVESVDFEYMADLVHCKNGSAIGIEKVYRRLGLYYVIGRKSLYWIRHHLPVELSISHPKKGQHSVLIVRVRGSKLWLTNYAHDRLHCVVWSALVPKIVHYCEYRSFRLEV